MPKTNETIVPSPLKRGDHVAIIATARKVSIDILSKAEQILQSWGLVCLRSPNLLREHHQFSGSDDQRRSDLQWAMNEPDVKAIICFRGGYGTVRLLNQLDPKQLIEQPKWIIGYSDVTALHLYLNEQNVASIHGTMPINFLENSSSSLESLQALLFDSVYEVVAPAHSFNRSGIVRSQVIGGNLAIVQSLMGTPYEIDTKGKILFLEDVDEYLYNIDRMMWTLKLSGKLNDLAGLIVGGMTDLNDNDKPFGSSAYESILEKVKDYNYPICFDFPAGHIHNNNAIPFGINLELMIDEKGVSLKKH